MKKIKIENRYGLRYPSSAGYYGIIISSSCGLSIYSMRMYTIDIFNSDDEFVTTIVCEHGEW